MFIEINFKFFNNEILFLYRVVGDINFIDVRFDNCLFATLINLI